MRLALLQCTLNARSRAGNIQGLIAAFQAAVQREPAPDVVALPMNCDTGGGAMSRAFPEACLIMVRETLAALAREWGVYCLAGLHTRRGNAWHRDTVLLDADGDLCAASGEADSDDRWGGGDSCCSTGFGDIALNAPESPPTCEGAAVHGSPAETSRAFALPRLVLSVWGSTASPARRRRLDEWRDTVGPAVDGTYRAIVVAAGDDGSGGGGLRSCVWAPDGKVLAIAADGGPMALHIEMT